MAAIYTILVLFLAVFVAGFILLIMGAINFDVSNSEIPPGMNQPVKLRIIHIILICIAVVVSLTAYDFCGKNGESVNLELDAVIEPCLNQFSERKAGHGYHAVSCS